MTDHIDLSMTRDEVEAQLYNFVPERLLDAYRSGQAKLLCALDAEEPLLCYMCPESNPATWRGMGGLGVCDRHKEFVKDEDQWKPIGQPEPEHGCGEIEEALARHANRVSEGVRAAQAADEQGCGGSGLLPPPDIREGEVSEDAIVALAEANCAAPWSDVGGERRERYKDVARANLEIAWPGIAVLLHQARQAERERIREELTNLDSPVVEALAKFLCGADANIHGTASWNQQPSHAKDSWRLFVADPLAKTILATLDQEGER